MPINPIKHQRRSQGQGGNVPRATPYQRLYGLRENPFPSMALFTGATDDPRLNGTIYDAEFRRAEEQRFFNLFVQPRDDGRPLPLGFLRVDAQAGGRGNGKSTFLHHIQRRINEQDWGEWASDPEDANLFAAAVHLLPEPKKQKEFHAFIRLIFETLHRQKLFPRIDAALRGALLTSLLEESEIDELAELPPDALFTTLGDPAHFQEFLRQCGHTSQALAEVAKNRLGELDADALESEFVQDYLLHGADIQLAWRESAHKSEARWRDKGALWLTNGLSSLLLLAGYRRFYVLLDEFEKIYTHQIARKREEFLDLFRQHFFERDSVAVRHQFLSSVLTIHPSIDRYLRETWGRVGLEGLAPLATDEIERRAVELGESDTKKLNHLLITYLDYYRADGDAHMGTLYPFEAGAMDDAFNKARFYPRQSLLYAYEVLQRAANEERSPPIYSEVVSHFLFEEDSDLTLPSEDDDIPDLRDEEP